MVSQVRVTRLKTRLISAAVSGDQAGVGGYTAKSLAEQIRDHEARQR
jgi:hypothetical protein